MVLPFSPHMVVRVGSAHRMRWREGKTRIKPRGKVINRVFHTLLITVEENPLGIKIGLELAFQAYFL